MSVVLAIEPDRAQADALQAVLHGRLGAGLVVVSSKSQAVEAIDDSVPDLILVTALLSTRDEDDLVAHLRTLEDAAHLQLLTIPRLGRAVAEPPKKGSLFGFKKKKGAPPPPEGCDPAEFAEQVATYLVRAREMRARPRRSIDRADPAPAEQSWYQPSAEEPSTFTASSSAAQAWPDPPARDLVPSSVGESGSTTDAFARVVAWPEAEASSTEPHPETAESPVFLDYTNTPALPKTPDAVADEVDRLIVRLGGGPSGLSLDAIERELHDEMLPSPPPAVPPDAVGLPAITVGTVGQEMATEEPISSDAVRVPVVDIDQIRAEAEAAMAAELARVQADAAQRRDEERQRWAAESEALRQQTVQRTRSEADAEIARVQAEATARREAELARLQEEAAARREAELERWQAEAEALRLETVNRARAEAEAEARQALSAEIARVQAEANERREAELAARQAEADALRAEAEALREETVERARIEAEAEAREALAAELARARQESERLRQEELSRLQVEAEHRLDEVTRQARMVAESEAARAFTEELTRVRSESEAAAARALEEEVARVRGEAEARLEAELARLRDEAQAARRAERTEAHVEVERLRETAAREAREVAEAAASKALQAELQRVRAEADQRLASEIAQLRADAERRRSMELEEVKRQVAAMRDEATDQARAAAEQAVAALRTAAAPRAVPVVRPANTPSPVIAPTGIPPVEAADAPAASSSYYELWQSEGAAAAAASAVAVPLASVASVGNRFRKHRAAFAAAASLLIVIAVSARVDTTAWRASARKAFTSALPVREPAKPVAAAPVVPAGDLLVETTPKGARVSVDGTVRGETPLTVKGLIPGRHKLVLEGRDGVVLRREVLIRDGERAVASELLVSGWIAVHSRIPLEIMVAGRRVGSSGDGQLMLSPGRHKVTLVNERFNVRETRSIEVQAGAIASHTITLPLGTVSVEAPAGAGVWIDGERMGDAPLHGLKVALGTREVVVRHTDIGEYRETVEVRNGTPTVVTVGHGGTATGIDRSFDGLKVLSESAANPGVRKRRQ